MLEEGQSGFIEEGAEGGTPGQLYRVDHVVTHASHVAEVEARLCTAQYKADDVRGSEELEKRSR